MISSIAFCVASRFLLLIELTKKLLRSTDWSNNMYKINRNTNAILRKTFVTDFKYLPIEYKAKISGEQAQQQQYKILAQEENKNHCSIKLAEIDERLKWTACYSDDIYKYWKSIELTRSFFHLSRMSFVWRSKQIVALKYLVQKYNFSNLTLHLAVYILDTFQSCNIITRDQRTLTVIACFIVAAKVEEDEFKIPTLAQLNIALLKINRFSRFYTLKEFEKYEIKLLHCIQFKLTVPTVATFANFYSKITITLEEFHVWWRVMVNVNSLPLFKSHQDMLTAINKLLFRLIDISCDIICLRNTLPSKIAAACVCAARQLNNIIPKWSTNWETLTQFDEMDLLPIVNTIIDVHNKKPVV